MSWLEIIKLGMPGAVGLLLAGAAVAWIQPANYGGVCIIFILCVALAYILVKTMEAIIRLVGARTGAKADNPVPDKPTDD